MHCSGDGSTTDMARSLIACLHLQLGGCVRTHAGSQIRSLGGSVEPVFANSTELRLVNSSVSDNFVQSPYGGVIRGTPGASVWLENTSILRNQAVILLSGASDRYPDLLANPAVFHSDVPRTVLRDLLKHETQPAPTDPSSFLSSTSAWFVDVRKVWH